MKGTMGNLPDHLDVPFRKAVLDCALENLPMVRLCRIQPLLNRTVLSLLGHGLDLRVILADHDDTDPFHT